MRCVPETRDGPVNPASADILWRAKRVLLDRALNEMMAVQMLIAEPAQFGAHFELVADGFPAARVYRVR